MSAVWDELNARPITPAPAWTRAAPGLEPMEALPRIGRTVRLRGQPPCTVCGNKGRWQCDCDEENNNG